MLEQLLVFTRGGLILWKMGCALKGSPIDTLIRSCLLEERSGDRSFRYDAPGGSYTLKWSFHNELGLVFVAVYQQFLHLLYVDELLSMLKREFSQIYEPQKASYPGFDEVYRQLLKEAQARAEVNKGLNKPIKQVEVGGRNVDPVKDLGNGKPGNLIGGSDSENGDDSDGHANGKVEASNGINGKVDSSSDDDPVKVKEAAFDRSKLQKLRATKGKKSAPAVKKEAAKKNVKEKISEPTKLDFTNSKAEVVQEKPLVFGKSLVDEEDEEDDEEVASGAPQPPVPKGWFSSVFSSVTGKAALEESDIEPAMKALKDRLRTKNVAEEIAEKICDSVATSLVGKKLGSFTRISTVVKEAMADALVRILTPKRSIDILRDVQSAKANRRPYVIVFVGVNGVGKSTNLAKVAYWLLNHGHSVMLAACDTFRSGAVEQLNVHARRLDIKLYEKGYEKDPSNVAKQAIAEATRNNIDVVLVDTAGRMQDNEPLMRALANLISVNKPNLVMFVGEALVGNEAVDQLSKFNEKLSDLSKRNVIDGILLTKYDTIDDKVGAALSMVYTSGAPIMFVGCGQDYPDLRRLNVRSIVNTLLR